ELPRIDGLFIGGGFPERYAAELQANTKLRDSIKTAIENGLPAYAECGGLMYLSRSLNWQGKTFDMVGAIPGDTRMHEKSCGRGYVKLEENSGSFPGDRVMIRPH
ncbi:MAG: cobyrinic acid a,c-diamide synthase, partial [Gammaproteobacteria bacterium]|nr:cobyrinic acid a,c-diamide synthase [Gammaproteobacteria bacterium]